MKQLLLELLEDRFGLNKRNLKTLLQMVEDDEGEGEFGSLVADEIEERISEKIINHDGVECIRFVIE